MKLTEDKAGARYLINAHEPGRVTINHVVHTRSLIVGPERLVVEWRPRNMAELRLDDIDEVLIDAPEIVLLGTGNRQQFPNAEILGRFAAAGIGCEVMDNAAACRTYTVLTSERRRVIAALLLGD
ncbi:Mth938-like domain-containing protein [Acidihalobacter ferrooxydans]|uniref:Xcc1710-like domain-containing protein n=1 Tax=Acidihalobacter ferrooxydans TaxID=1765967 RepID=A0A1P8UHW8_9GAMM|nr:Mth938-like domain-containing protein [Acidihalobacter ferrooxydans]APZ43436.1 hypothetical protein BW247_10350 [Acidihalobacter ferrooxydans]